MKIVFLFFAALNVAFFFWQSESYGLGNSNKPARFQPVIGNTPTLVLLEEAQRLKDEPKNKAAEKTQTAMLNTKERSKPPAGRKLAACFTLGPFEELQSARAVATKLDEIGAHAYERKQKHRVSSGYWVYLPSFDTWQDAKQKVNELEKQGMKDAFIMGRGKMKNAVSLGLFKNKAASDRRLKQLQRLGIKPRVETQYSQVDKFWLDIDVESGKTQAVTSIETIANGMSFLELKTRPCK
ncbi:SPOR domain-containing protein [Kaarinaea lacus]